MKHLIPTEIQRSEFLRDGYLIVDEFLSLSEIDSILESVKDYVNKGGPVLQVDRKDLIATQVFKTIVGDDCERNVALFSHLWRERILDLTRKLVPFDLVPLNDASIGINVNITERSGQISYHYDRNEVTAILYLQECAGGVLEMYPRYRLLLKNRYRQYKKWLQRLFDVIWRTPIALHLARKRKKEIPPRVGRLIVMRGPLALHRVSPVLDGPNRICGVFCYDKTDVRWEPWNSKDNYVVQARKKAEKDARSSGMVMK